jgi:hypothetical protein
VTTADLDFQIRNLLAELEAPGRVFEGFVDIYEIARIMSKLRVNKPGSDNNAHML